VVLSAWKTAAVGNFFHGSSRFAFRTQGKSERQGHFERSHQA